MSTTQNRRGSATLIFAIVVAITLVGCGVATTPEERAAASSSETQSLEPTPLTPEYVGSLDCKEVTEVAATFDELDRTGDNDVYNWIPAGKNVADVQLTLDAQIVKVCASTETQSPAPSASASASPSPLASPSPSASASPSPSAAAPQTPSNFGSWEKVVSEPPAGLEDAISTHADRLGWGWEEAKDWARAETPDSESRIILAFDEMTRDEARLAVGINPKTPVPVVHTTECVSLMGPLCPTTGAVVVLSQLTEGAVPLLGSGIVQWEENFSLVVDLVGTQVKE